jgi:predicted DNA-binding transcriptional regulator AlpA
MSTDADDPLVPDPEVRKRYSRSEMTIWRWDQTPTLGFPKPIRINGRKYRRLSELREWERKQAAASSEPATIAAE